MAKIHFRTISREIRNAQKGLRSGRARAAAEGRTEIDDLIAKLEGIHTQVAAACPKVMAGYVVARPAVRAKKGANKTKTKRRKR
jgi:hypothetical protein